MKLINKFKDLFTEEIEEEVPIKKEVKHVEIPDPKDEMVKEEMRDIAEEEPISESVALNREEKFKFPVYFDDKDFADLEQPKKEEEPPKRAVKEEIKVEPYIEPYTAANQIEEKRNFKPSPIISPVYGVLNENYQKEDISINPVNTTKRHTEEEKITVDDVRKKAYGTLEDELEDTLYASGPIVEDVADVEIDIFKELESTEAKHVSKETEEVDVDKELKRQKEKIDEINEFIKNTKASKEEKEEEISLEEPEEVEEIKEEPALEVPESIDVEEEEVSIADEEIKEDKEVEEVKDEEPGDLFNLIDSMYEKREEE